MKRISRKTLIRGGVICALITLSALSFVNFGDGSRVLFADVAAEEKPLRLHVLANSDSEFDQQLKLELRDHIIHILEPQLSAAVSKEQAMEKLSGELPELTGICNEFLAGKTDYRATVSLERADFPEIDYNGMVFAAGEYDSLRIVLGEGEGHNWWCVLFPPLCFVDLATERGGGAQAVWAPYSREEQNQGLAVRWKLSGFFAGS